MVTTTWALKRFLFVIDCQILTMHGAQGTKLDRNFAAKLKLYMSCYIHRAVRHIEMISIRLNAVK